MAHTSRVQRLQADGGYKTRLIRNLVLLTLVTAGAIASVFLYEAYSAVEGLSNTAIGETAEGTKSDLDAFFRPVRSNLEVAADWGKSGEISLSNHEALNARFIPVLTRNPQISSMLFANTQGQEYLLLKSGETWVNRLTDKAQRGDHTLWKRWDANGGLVEEWSEELDYDSRKRPWYQGAMKSEKRAIFWTEPYVFFTTKDPGITASTRFERDGESYVIAFDLMLLDVSRFTTQISPSPNGKVAVLAHDGRVLGLPKSPEYEDSDALKSAVLKTLEEMPTSELSAMWAFWTEARQEIDRFSFESNGEDWLAGIHRYPLGETALTIAVLVPTADFVREIDERRNLIILITALALLGAVIIGIITARGFTRRIDEAVEAIQQLGQYTLDRKIGEGGMGDVYRAHHAMLRRPTAVKLIKPNLQTPELVKRFEREVQLTCRLTHPNTIVIYDYGRTPGGVFYYAMEYLDGVSMLGFLQNTGPLPVGRALHLLEQACESLREAHDIGLVHRDIKPGNLFMCERGGVADTVKVLDFGLVKEFGGEDLEATVQNGAHGTPGYIAPEWIVDPSTAHPVGDVYAIGAVAYAMFTGAPAYMGDTAMGIFMKQMSSDPVPPIELRPDLPQEINDLVTDCMQRNPAERVASMAAVLQRIRQCMDYGSWSHDDAREWWDLHGGSMKAEARGATISATALTVDIASRTEHDEQT